ncbi:DUF1674 domain-containing protein [Gluconacetobacter azotocaptans]|uniref:DUF1674 domain-containing protein n=1 Tax=Gluconacetobacter azotocaptans TaxID=142834 RepID=A0A7W4JSF6_9PROT|nr:DUF1674 domain-containing protein [Gluconacetobacter azotocaptans]MBB2190027.1 DUF1674 domain-containing protein [Gluconacetobacter azotocaptans]MBM9401802.1 DUF1674 domain-containing protein [Gluconacetobacter azotocaptans]GBQ37324.1 hypothetical protein AA13594_3468 [Gluconacetobacter azotocaptans DSM 13594]
MTSTDTHTDKPAGETTADATGKPVEASTEAPTEAQEYGGPKEDRPTRYGDWTVKGRCIDF